MTRRYAAVIAALAIAVTAMLCGRCRARYYTHEGVVWTTGYHIIYKANRDLSDSIQYIFNNLDMSVSPYNKASLLTALNQNATTRVDEHIKRLIAASVAVHRASGGAFDPTVMPLVNAWGFGYKSGTLPSRAQTDSILQFVGLDKIALHGDTLLKQDPRVMLDFSSIAKGLACDEIGRMLARNNVRDWLVEIGGEVTASGKSPRGTAWQVSVDLPDDGQDSTTHQSAAVLTLNGGAVATSGNYRKWRQQGDGKISHIIDPRTGDSRAGTLLSVTVTASDCMSADAWATACMVMGTQQTQSLMKGRDDLGVMTISLDTAANALVVWSNAALARQLVTGQ